MLECVVNISEGRDPGIVSGVAAAAGDCLLDIHSDRDHNRSVLTLAGPPDSLPAAVEAVARAALARIDIRGHTGAHPSIGALDVVPWVDLARPAAVSEVARVARDRFATWAGTTLGLPCFLYGPERSLPDVRRGAFSTLAPDAGPRVPHPTAGACAVGARGVLVAYNLWISGTDTAGARRIAAAVRSADLRTLGLAVGARIQVSCNLVRPDRVDPAAAYDLVAAAAGAEGATVEGAELVGLVPDRVLQGVERRRWPALDLAEDRTIESRLPRA